MFINRGAAEAPLPYGLDAGPGKMLCVYSSAERARSAAHGNGLVAEEDPVPLFGVPSPAALGWAMSLGETGVVGLTIDYPLLGAWCPLPNLARLRDGRADVESPLD